MVRAQVPVEESEQGKEPGKGREAGRQEVSSRYLQSSEGGKKREAYEDQDDVIIRIVFVVHMDVPVVLSLNLEGEEGQTKERGKQRDGGGSEAELTCSCVEAFLPRGTRAWP